MRSITSKSTGKLTSVEMTAEPVTHDWWLQHTPALGHYLYLRAPDTNRIEACSCGVPSSCACSTR